MQKRYDQIRVLGSPDGMFVKDAYGRNIQVFAVNIALRAGHPPVMQLNLLAQPFDVQGVPTFMAQDPDTGQPKAVRRIEFHDGTVHEFPEAPKPPVAMSQPAGGPATSDPPGVRPITPAAIQPGDASTEKVGGDNIVPLKGGNADAG